MKLPSKGTVEPTTLIIVLPNYYNPASNGHVVALNTCKTLCAKIRGHRLIATSGSESSQTVDVYRNILGDQYCSEGSELIAEATRHPYSLMCPDDIEGSRSQVSVASLANPNCRRIYVTGFAPLGVFSPGSSLDHYFQTYDDRFRLSFFSQWIPPADLVKSKELIDVYQETTLPADASYEPNAMADIAIYCGKGVYSLSERHQLLFRNLERTAKLANRSIHLITREHPATKEGLYKVLSSCLLLICLDPFSHIEREATSLGCAVWKPNCPVPGRLPGIFYGDFNLESMIKKFHGESGEIIKAKKDLSIAALEYSTILHRSAKTKQRIYVNSIQKSLDERMHLPHESCLARKVIIEFSQELIASLKSHARSYAKFLHPIPRSPDEFNYPVMNNSLTLESALSLLRGAPMTDEELNYKSGLNGFEN